MKDVQCYELFGGIVLKNHAFSFFYFIDKRKFKCKAKYKQTKKTIIDR